MIKLQAVAADGKNIKLKRPILWQYSLVFGVVVLVQRSLLRHSPPYIVLFTNLLHYEIRSVLTVAHSLL